MLRIENVGDQITSSGGILITDEFEEVDDVIPINIASRLGNELGKDLLKAASDGNIVETQRLLFEGAPFTADWLGTSPLHLAAQGNHVEICEILVRAGISTNARTKVDRTPLHMASYEGHIDVVQLLLREEAGVDETDLLGMTPLHWAVQNGHLEVVKVLLNSGASRESENKFGLKPIDIAQQISRYDIIAALEEEELEDTRAATEHLEIEMANAGEEESSSLNPNMIAMEDIDEDSNLEDEIPQIKLECNDSQMDNSLSDSMKILQEHGITLLPTDDDNNILTTVMESGHSVVLTEVGKQILESVRAEEESAQNITRNMVNIERERFMNLNPDELLTFSPQNGVDKQKKQKQGIGKESKNIKRIVMKKNKLQPISLASNILKPPNPNVQMVRLNLKESEMDRILKELTEAKKTIEEYKQKLQQKEAEIEGYKLKLKLLGYS